MPYQNPPARICDRAGRLNALAEPRDHMKNALCEAAGFELLRIESLSLSVNVKLGNRRLIEYLIDAWKLGKAFYKYQKKGLVPEDEIYDYRNIIELNMATE